MGITNANHKMAQITAAFCGNSRRSTFTVAVPIVQAVRESKSSSKERNLKTYFKTNN